MAQLRHDYTKYQSVNTFILVVGPEDANSFKKYWEKHRLKFIGIPDPEHKILKLYGQQVNIFKLGRMPAQAIIDRKGEVRYIHYGKTMSDIPKTEETLQVLKEINTELNYDPL